MKLLHFLFLSSLSSLLSAQAVLPSPELGKDVAEERLRVALWECFGLREQIEFLEVLDYAPAATWLDQSQSLHLHQSGVKSNAGPILKDEGATFVWSGSSRNTHTRMDKAVTIRFRIRALVERVAALRPLVAGETLSADAIAITKIPWKPTIMRPPLLKPRLETIFGMVLTRSLAKGAFLLPEFVAEPPVVREGETVWFLVEHAGLSLRTEAVALQSGRVGDLVFLKRLDTGLRMRGVVWRTGAVKPQSSIPERQPKL